MGNITDTMNRQAAACRDMEDLLDFCREFDSEMVNFQKFMKSYLSQHNITEEAFISCYTSSMKSYVKKWLTGESMPRNRSGFIRIAIYLGMTVSEANLFLTRVGGYGKLYPKNIEDAACIHALTHHLNYTDYENLTKRMISELQEIMYNETKDLFPQEYVEIRDSLPHDDRYFESVKLLNEKYEAAEEKEKISHKKTLHNALKNQEKILRLKLLDEETDFVGTEVIMENPDAMTDMIGYVRDNWKAILTANYRLRQYIDECLKESGLTNHRGKPISTINGLFEYYLDEYVDRTRSITVISDEVYRKITVDYSRMKTSRHLDLKRNYLIFIGILLNWEEEQINTMLEIAHMDHLCARRDSEAAIIAALHRGNDKPIDFIEFIFDNPGTQSLYLDQLNDLIY